MGNNFDATAADLSEKYAEQSGNGAAGEAEPDNGSSAPGPEVIPPERVDFISRAVVEKYVRIFFDGMERAKGERWRVDQWESDFYSQLTTDAANEQLPRWLADSPNKALYAWIGATLLMVSARSETGEKFIQWLMNVITNLFTRHAEKSQASSAS